MQNPRMPPPEGNLHTKSRKKKPAFQGAPPYQGPEETFRGALQPLPPPLKVSKKAFKRTTLKNDISPSFQQPERSNSDSLPDSSRWEEEYRALRRKHFLLEEVSLDVERELKVVEDEVNVLEDEKLALLDQLVVLEGLIDPSEIQTQRSPM